MRCVLPVPFAPFLRSMGTAIYPRHILRPYVDDGTFAEVWDIDTDPSAVIGTGPFTIAATNPANAWCYSVIPTTGSWTRPAILCPTWRKSSTSSCPISKPNSPASRPASRTFTASWARNTPSSNRCRREGNFTIHRRGPGFGSEFLTFNVNPGAVSAVKLSWFENTRFRQAVAHIVDRRRIIDEVLHGLGYPQWSSVSPAAGAFHNPDVRRHEYDVAEANRLLDELGWADTDGDGFREDQSGNPIVFSMVTNAGNSVREQIGTIIQHGLTDIGIETDYTLIDFGDLCRQVDRHLRLGRRDHRLYRRLGPVQRHRFLAQQRGPASVAPEPDGTGNRVGNRD